MSDCWLDNGGEKWKWLRCITLADDVSFEVKQGGNLSVPKIRKVKILSGLKFSLCHKYFLKIHKIS